MIQRSELEGVIGEMVRKSLALDGVPLVGWLSSKAFFRVYVVDKDIHK